MPPIKAPWICISIADVWKSHFLGPALTLLVSSFSLYQVYRGVRIGGLHMGLKDAQNKGAPHFPHDYPDCPAGVRFQEEQEGEFLVKFKRSGGN